MKAAPLSPYIIPLGYHYPTPLQKDSKSDLVSRSPLRNKELCIQIKKS